MGFSRYAFVALLVFLAAEPSLGGLARARVLKDARLAPTMVEDPSVVALYEVVEFLKSAQAAPLSEPLKGSVMKSQSAVSATQSDCPGIHECSADETPSATNKCCLTNTSAYCPSDAEEGCTCDTSSAWYSFNGSPAYSSETWATDCPAPVKSNPTETPKPETNSTATICKWILLISWILLAGFRISGTFTSMKFDTSTTVIIAIMCFIGLVLSALSFVPAMERFNMFVLIGWWCLLALMFGGKAVFAALTPSDINAGNHKENDFTDIMKASNPTEQTTYQTAEVKTGYPTTEYEVEDSAERDAEALAEALKNACDLYENVDEKFQYEVENECSTFRRTSFKNKDKVPQFQKLLKMLDPEEEDDKNLIALLKEYLWGTFDIMILEDCAKYVEKGAEVIHGETVEEFMHNIKKAETNKEKLELALDLSKWIDDPESYVELDQDDKILLAAVHEYASHFKSIEEKRSEVES